MYYMNQPINLLDPTQHYLLQVYYEASTSFLISGTEAIKTYNSFDMTDETHRNLSEIMKEFDKYAIGETNETYERYIFNSRDQKEEENIDRYVAELRTLAQSCGFCKCLNDSLIRDRIVRYKDVFEVHDDKVIYGVEETEEEATADHKKKLQHFLQHCKEKGMKLNKKNLKLKCKEITYLGHLITQNGLSQTQRK
ncbi:hypothetical protein QZH41_001001 [Actinostola sp. cb2023]|nr:hypothetical protein QZH41_001001 [Actinostola sp. cb2023]